MKCSVAQRLMSSYLDNAVTRSEFSQVDEHLKGCAGCAARYASLQGTQRLVGSLGRKPSPADLTLRLRVALSQEMATVQRSRWDSRWEMMRVHWENAFNAFMVPATASVVTTLIIFGLLISFLVPAQLTASNDVPTVFYTPPELQYTPFELGMGNAADSLVVEAYVGADGRVLDYRILSGGDNTDQILHDLKNMLIFTTFQPATSFGRPTAGRAILTFSKIQVKG
jgi:hypothetical protein